MVELRFRTFSNGTISARIVQIVGAIDHGNCDCTLVTEHKDIMVGYHIFDTDFYKYELSRFGAIQTLDDLNLVNYTTKSRIPLYNAAYKDEEYGSSQSYSLSNRYMQLYNNSSISLSDKVSYHNKLQKTSIHSYTYECNSEQDVAIAELHYYVTHGYKFTYCEMCGKPFYTKTLKSKYCQRIGENPKYPNHSCNKARQLERDKISRNKNKIAQLKKEIYNTLTPLRIGEHIKCQEDIKNEYASRYYDEYIKHCTDSQEYAEYVRNKFLVECDEYKKSHSDVEYAIWMHEQYKRYLPNGRKTSPV